MSILSDGQPPAGSSSEHTPLLPRDTLQPPSVSSSHSLNRSVGRAAGSAYSDATMGNPDEGSASTSRHSPQPVDTGTGDAHYSNYGGLKELDRYNEQPAQSDTDGESTHSDAQAGVKQIEAISLTWTKWSLIIAYIGIFLLAISTSLEVQTTSNLTVYATSSYDQHSLVSTVSLVGSVVNSVIKPPMSKIANTFGRLEAYSFAVILYVCGYIQMAASANFATFASAQIFYAAGSQGLQMLQQIFIADTSNLLTRALFSSLPDTPFLFTTWCGAPIAQSILSSAGWRWGYGLWAIVLPACFAPLALSLFLNMRKAAKRGLLPPRPWSKGESPVQVVKTLWFDLDVGGLILLSAAIACLLLPLTFGSTAIDGYRTPWIIALFVVGAVCWFAFPAWELTPALAPKPFLTLRMLTNRNVVLGSVLGFFYFGVFYTSVQPYFYSYLQVVQFLDITSAGYITSTFSFSATVSSILVSLLIWSTKHFKWYIVFGAALYMVGVGLIIRFRDQGATIAQLVGPQVALGIGGGMVNVPAQLAVQAAVPHQDVAAATALFLTLVEIGGAVGNAISGAIWTANLPAYLELYLPDGSKDLAEPIFANLTMAMAYPAGSEIRNAINRSYQDTMNKLLIVSLVFAALTFVFACALKSVRLDEIDQKVKGTVIGGTRQQNAETESSHRED